MRPPAVEKLGYYPTDEPVIDILNTYIAPAPEKARLFDPCAGEGIAASKLGKALNCATWGVELSPARAAKAGQVLDRVFQAPWQACFLSNESISLLFLNPPYESDEDHKRVELDFLSSTTSKLVRGGLLIYIVPQHILGLVQVARILAGQYECLTVGRFPDGLFEKFKQVVVLGYRRKSYIIPTEAEIEAVQAWAKMELEPLTPLDEPVYHLIPAPERGLDGRLVIFKRTDWEAEDVVEATRACGFQRTKEWLDLIQPDHNQAELTQPVMPLKKGHVAMLMASGMMGTVRLIDDEGRPMLIKGRVVKKVEKVGEEGKGEEITETYRDRFVTTVAVLKQDKIEVIQDIQGLVPFMKAYGEKIAAHVMNTYRPLYNFDPTPHEIQVLDRLGQDRKPLPGQDRPGLLSTQRHAAAALARCIRKHGVANCQAEMGSGKSSISAAVIDLLNAYPALIICPPHLVPKWIREVEEVIPGVHAREIRRIGRNAEDPGDINDVRAFLEDYDAGRVGKKAVAVVANTAAKFGAGWKPAAMRKRTTDPLTGQRIWAYACPTCGTVIETEENGVIVPVTDLEQLAKKRHFCRAMIPGWQLNPDGTRKLDADGNPIWGARLCNTPLFAFTATRRESIAEYIAKKASGRFRILVSDELHQFKGKSSDRGVAFHQLVTACKSTLTLTGTFFGGKSTSIFWLLHRLNAGVRRDFAFNEELRWARLYGVLETKRKRRRDDADEDGVFTGNRRYRNNAKEQPGISPAVINRLLDTTIFLSLKDLGLALPAYNEEVITLEMLDEQSSQYQQMESTLKSMALQSNRYLSTWLQWSLARPNSAFREETVMIDEAKDDKGKVVRKVPLMVLPPVVNGNPKWLPKEGWLADFCRNEKRQGRKVLVYVRQTGTRDIQDRVVEPLKEAGLRVAILSSGVNPRRREEWIANRALHTDVLVCNPKLVETGLDLVQFATVVFFEQEYSLYCLWQAVRRVWRLGQTKPVKALFSVYEGTMEARALALMGRKMRAAQTLYGDEVGGAIVPQEDGDLLTELAREVLSDADLPDLQAMFADDMLVSHNPMGSLTLASAVIIPETKVITWADWVSGKIVLNHKEKKKEVIPEGQMGLGI